AAGAWRVSWWAVARGALPSLAAGASGGALGGAFGPPIVHRQRPFDFAPRIARQRATSRDVPQRAAARAARAARPPAPGARAAEDPGTRGASRPARGPPLRGGPRNGRTGGAARAS